MTSALFALACALLVYAGAVKAASGSRVLGGGEVVLGAAALVFGGRVLAALVAASYAAFAVYVVLALRRGAESCGCFGAEEATPPSRRHVAIDGALAAGALLAVIAGAAAPLDVAAGTPGAGIVYALFLISATGMTAAALTA